MNFETISAVDLYNWVEAHDVETGDAIERMVALEAWDRRFAETWTGAHPLIGGGAHIEP